MPIYEYECRYPEQSCPQCSRAFEVIQEIKDPPLATCPKCGQPVRKLISWCRAAILETPEEHTQVSRKIADYEQQGMWSHAAELADTHSEKTKDKKMKMRAIDNYEKAGYSADTLEKHSKTNNI